MGFLKGGNILLLFREWGNSFGYLWRAKALRGIQPQKMFAVVLERERARADRNGEEFSLIVFKVNRRSSEAIALRNALSQRIRSTDMIGWFQGKMSVLLTDTPPSGAWKLADDIRQKMLGASLPVACTVYSYPFHNGLDSNDRNGFGEVLLIDSCPK